MLLRMFAITCFLAAFTAADDAWSASVFAAADNAALFEGLIPGEPLGNEELGQYYGRGVSVNFNLGDGTEFTLEDYQFNNSAGTISTADTSTLTNDSMFSDNAGIFQNTPVIGDGNQVNINVNITVNMNTVDVFDSAGASVLVNQTLDFGGTISAFEP
jgi:hypothetical protein